MTQNTQYVQSRIFIWAFTSLVSRTLSPQTTTAAVVSSCFYYLLVFRARSGKFWTKVMNPVQQVLFLMLSDTPAVSQSVSVTSQLDLSMSAPWCLCALCATERPEGQTLSFICKIHVRASRVNKWECEYFVSLIISLRWKQQLSPHSSQTSISFMTSRWF